MKTTDEILAEMEGRCEEANDRNKPSVASQKEWFTGLAMFGQNARRDLPRCIKAIRETLKELDWWHENDDSCVISPLRDTVKEMIRKILTGEGGE